MNAYEPEYVFDADVIAVPVPDTSTPVGAVASAPMYDVIAPRDVADEVVTATEPDSTVVTARHRTYTCVDAVVLAPTRVHPDGVVTVPVVATDIIRTSPTAFDGYAIVIVVVADAVATAETARRVTCDIRASSYEEEISSPSGSRSG
jgi:hypothetical protein